MPANPIDDMDLDEMTEIRPGVFKRLGDLNRDEFHQSVVLSGICAAMAREVAKLIHRVEAHALAQYLLGAPLAVVPLPAELRSGMAGTRDGEPTYLELQRDVDVMRACVRELGA